MENNKDENQDIKIVKITHDEVVQIEDLDENERYCYGLFESIYQEKDSPFPVILQANEKYCNILKLAEGVYTNYSNDLPMFMILPKHINHNLFVVTIITPEKLEVKEHIYCSLEALVKDGWMAD